ncbi:MAG: ribose 5-phosphate isomerase B [Bacteroidota bacterium]|nr:ribose 5-phosphate isomerase B [Bacteroidota bacterium]
MINKKIAIGCDHAGFELKAELKKYLNKKKYSFEDFGTNTGNSVDYPDHIHPVAQLVEEGKVEFGIIICGSGNGASMTANKHQGIRAALCWNKELATLAKLHNNANIISLPARFITFETAKKIIDAYLNTDFEGERHQRRIDKIPLS